MIRTCIRIFLPLVAAASLGWAQDELGVLLKTKNNANAAVPRLLITGHVAVSQVRIANSHLVIEPSDPSLGATGEIRFRALNNGYFTGLKGPSNLSGDITWTLPDAVGMPGQVLTRTGASSLGWTTPQAAGTVASIAAGTPGLPSGSSGLTISPDPITTQGTISIASGGVTNAMLANPSLSVVAGTGLTGGGAVPLGGSVQMTLSDTGVGAGSYGSSSSVATLTVNAQGRLTGVVNVPIKLGTDQIGEGVLPLVRGGTGTDLSTAVDLPVKKAGSVFTTAPIGLNTAEVGGTLPVVRGGTGTSTAFGTGSIVFASTDGGYSQNNAQLFWDDSNARLGIGTSAPSTKLEVAGKIKATQGMDAGGQQVTNVATPLALTDAATKQYVDSRVASTSSPISGFANRMLSKDWANTLDAVIYQDNHVQIWTRGTHPKSGTTIAASAWVRVLIPIGYSCWVAGVTTVSDVASDGIQKAGEEADGWNRIVNLSDFVDGQGLGVSLAYRGGVPRGYQFTVQRQTVPSGGQQHYFHVFGVRVGNEPPVVAD